MSRKPLPAHPAAGWPEAPVPASLARISSPEDFIEAFRVSRETADRLTVYEGLLRQWQKGTNLVSPASLDHVWHRHFADSAQLLSHAGDWRKWIDLGSGAGFPALVVAICNANREDRRVHMVESNARKCAFAREVVRETGCSVEIHHSRIERLHHDARLAGVDIVSARALAPLDKLLGLAAPFFAPGTVGIFPKGKNAEQERADSARKWSCAMTLHPSLTDAEAAIVLVNGLQNRSNGLEGEC